VDVEGLALEYRGTHPLNRTLSRKPREKNPEPPPKKKQLNRRF
jgi:hypothetical protein